MGVKAYVVRIVKAIMNRPMMIYSMEKEYIIANARRCENRIAFVTGASGEIGGAIANRLAFEGAVVYLGGRNSTMLEKLADNINNKGFVSIPVTIDVSEEMSIKTAVDFIIRNSGKIDILVNCAGGSTRSNCAPLIDQKTEMIDEMLEVNLRGSMLCTRAVGKIMAKGGYGRIINIASVIGERGKVNFSDYAASKAGIIGYTRSVAQELGRYGITVNCVSPGFIQRGTFSDEQLPYLLKSNFVNRVGSADDVASAVAYLASDETPFITGQNLCVDGGRSLGLHGD